MFEITILGSGTSHGVPMIGCECAVCRSTNPFNRRYRPSILVRTESGSILVDTSPELRMQCLQFGVTMVDAVLITHTHADHIMGFDDLRRFNDIRRQAEMPVEIPVYGSPNWLEDIRRIFPYIFKETPLAGGKPHVTLHELPERLAMFGLDIEPLQVMHGTLPVSAFRFDFSDRAADSPAFASAAYVTDVNFIPEAAMGRLRGLDLLILDAVRFEPHPTHFGLEQALQVIGTLLPKRALLTHISHHFDHDAVNSNLPAHTRLAYDGQVITLC